MLWVCVAAWIGAPSPIHAAELAVEWEPPPDDAIISGYVLHYGTASGQYDSQLRVGPATATIIPDLLPGGTYYLVAAAIADDGTESVYSNELSYQVPSAPPQPEGFSDLWVISNTPSSWSPFTLSNLGFSTNWILFAASSNPTLIPSEGIAFAGTGSSRSIQITPGLDQLGLCTVTVYATDFATTNSASFQVDVTPPNQAPVVDAGLGTTVRTNLNYMLRGKATDDGLPHQPGRLTVRWSKVSGPGIVTFGNSNAAVSTIRLSAPGLYRLRLTASDGQLSSSSDMVIRAQLVSDVTAPTMTQFTALDVASDSVTLQWTTDELADGRVTFTLNDGVANFTPLDPVTKLLHVFTITNLQSDTEYRFVARSRDPSGNTTFSDPLVLSTLPLSFDFASSSSASPNVASPPVLASDSIQVPGDPVPVQKLTSGAEVETAEFPFVTASRDPQVVWMRVQNDIRAKISMSVDVPDVPDFHGALNLFPDATAGSAGLVDSLHDSSGMSKWIPVEFCDNEGQCQTVATRWSSGQHLMRITGPQARSRVLEILVTNDRSFVPEDGAVGAEIGTVDQAQLTIRKVIRSGWSLLSRPSGGGSTQLTQLFPEASVGSGFFKIQPGLTAYLTNWLSAQGWSDPGMSFSPGEAAVFFNAGEPFIWELQDVSVSPSASGVDLFGSPWKTGLNLVSPRFPRSGLLSHVVGDFTFRPGDRVYRLSSGSTQFQVSTFDGERWDILPVIGVGEGVLIQLQPR